MGPGKRRSEPTGVRNNIRQIFGTSIQEEFWATAWPGTELVGHKGRVLISKFDLNVGNKMLAAQPDITKWIHNGSPSLPEDLCIFLNGAPLPFMVSVTHEDDAWLLAPTNPLGKGVKEEKRARPNEFIYPGKYFCRPTAD
jgi:hypothetical protein